MRKGRYSVKTPSLGNKSENSLLLALGILAPSRAHKVIDLWLIFLHAQEGIRLLAVSKHSIYYYLFLQRIFMLYTVASKNKEQKSKKWRILECLHKKNIFRKQERARIIKGVNYSKDLVLKLIIYLVTLLVDIRTGSQQNIHNLSNICS